MTHRQSRRKRSNRRRSTSRKRTYQSASEFSLQAATGASARSLQWGKVPSAILASVCAGLLLFLFVGESYYVRGVQLQGSSMVTSADLLSASQVRGWSIFYINEHALEAKLSEALPSIQSIQVRCQLPNQLKITIQERAPQAAWDAANGRFLLDSKGRVLQPADSVRNLVLIKDGARNVVKLGDQMDVAEAIATAQEVAAQLGDVRVFGFTQEKGIILHHPNGYEVYFGVGGDVATKIANMRALIQQVEENRYTNVAYLDVRFANITIGFGSH